MDACIGTLVILGLLMVGLLVVAAANQRAKRRRAEEERVRAQAYHAQVAAYAQWQQQQMAAEQQQREARAAYERAQAEQARHASLVAKFGPDNAQRIIRHEVWQGQTVEMLIEALGRPADIDEKVLKTKTRHVYKYRPLAKNRYGLRVTLENGVVVGWDDKS